MNILTNNCLAYSAVYWADTHKLNSALNEEESLLEEQVFLRHLHQPRLQIKGWKGFYSLMAIDLRLVTCELF
jgi:hypothetical protein